MKRMGQHCHLPNAQQILLHSVGHIVEVAKQLAESSGLNIDTYLIKFRSRGLYSRYSGVHGRLVDQYLI